MTRARTALTIACIGLAGLQAPAWATPDLPIAVQVCPKEGRDPSAAALVFTHHCGVWTPDDFASAPTWRHLELLASDTGARGGAVTATLHCVSRGTGESTPVATVRSSYAPRVQSFMTKLAAPLAFNSCAYVVSVHVNKTSAQAEAPMVTLRN